MEVYGSAAKRTVEDEDPSEVLPSKRQRLKLNDGAGASPRGDESQLSSKVNEDRSGDISSADGSQNRLQLEKPTRKKQQSKKRDAAGYPKSRKGKEKSGKNVGRRSRRGTHQDGVPSGDEGEKPSQPKDTRYPKRQCALLMSFCGTGCSGMQFQPNAKTIEGILFSALVKAGAVSKDNADDPVKVNLGRAARTDAGVHAAGNLVSLKMITSRPDVPDMLAKINEELPPEIRLWGYVRVQNSFNARVSCDSRKYTYFFPTYVLLPPKPGSGLARTLQKHVESCDESTSPIIQLFWAGAETSSPIEDDLLRKRSWRIPASQLQQLRETVKRFEGTHNFHNFTVGREFADRSNYRHMKKIEIADPAVYGETEWISVLFHGQSFMLHQRKMMSMLVLSCRTGTAPYIVDALYGPSVVMIPKMPSLGLLLEYPIFDSYNNKVAIFNEKLDPSDPDYRPQINFDNYRDSIASFKQKFIYENMRKIEDQYGVFDAWIRSIDHYTGNDLLYLNPQGKIPPEAVITKGQRRANPLKEKKRFDTTNFQSEAADKMTTEDDDEIEAEDELIDEKSLMETEG